MYIKHLALSGFRGIGAHLDLPFAKRTIIFGPNGSGKTSLLQAIPWAIYGKLPALSGTVYTREDALVNDFYDASIAEVTLEFSGDVAISRTRRKQSSTTRGNNPLSLSIPADDEQLALENLIGLNLDEFFAAVFLYQETIRDFITTTPEKRGETIDRMLGAYLIRSLVKAIDPKLAADAILETKKRIEDIDQQLVQASVMNREVIRKRKEEYGDPRELSELEGRISEALLPIVQILDIPAPEPHLSSLEQTLTDAREAQLKRVQELENRGVRFGSLKTQYKQTIEIGWEKISQRKRQTGDPSELPTLIEEIAGGCVSKSTLLGIPEPSPAVSDLRVWLSTAQRTQLDLISSLEQKSARIAALQDRYQSVALDVTEDVQIPHELLNQRAAIQERLNTLNQEVSSLEKRLLRQHAIKDELAVLVEQVTALPPLQDEVARIQDQVERLEAERAKGSLYSQILSIGQQYLEQTEPDHCPLCKQQIGNLSALLRLLHEETPPDADAMQQASSELRAELSAKQKSADALVQRENQIVTLERELATLPEDLEAQAEYTQNTIQELTDDLTSVVAEINEAEARVKSANATKQLLSTLLGQIQSELGHPLGESIETDLRLGLETIRTRIEEIRLLDFQLITDKLDRVDQLNKIQQDEAQLLKQLDSILQEAERLIGQPISREETLIAVLDHAIQATSQRTAQVQHLEMGTVEKELNRAKQIEGIRKDEETLQQLESGFRTAQQEKQRLTYRIQRLVQLRSALQDIAETAKLRQQTIVMQLINALDVDRFYQQLDPHPAYCQLQIEPELTSRGTFNYWIKALTAERSHGTYVQTRFSTAQANAAAIAIFLAVNDHLSTNFETVILDDPSQSMDAAHKKRLAQTLTTIPRQVIVATEDEEMLHCLTEVFDDYICHQLESWTVGGASLANA